MAKQKIKRPSPTLLKSQTTFPSAKRKKYTTIILTPPPAYYFHTVPKEKKTTNVLIKNKEAIFNSTFSFQYYFLNYLSFLNILDQLYYNIILLLFNLWTVITLINNYSYGPVTSCQCLHVRLFTHSRLHVYVCGLHTEQLVSHWILQINGCRSMNG